MPERELVISHVIGSAGRFRLVAGNGSVRIDGVDGDEVQVLARYRAPAGVVLSTDPAEDGVVEVARGDGELHVGVRDAGGTGLRTSLTRLVGQHRPDVDFQVRLPRSAVLRLDAISGDAKLRGLRGEQDLHTVSGDLELRDGGGRIRVTTVSGDVAIRGDVLSLAATTTSGDLAVEAELVEQLAVKAVSGDVSVQAALGREAGHTFESVSGDLQLVTPNGLVIEVSGVSGSVRSNLPMRREQRDGRRVTVFGDGAVHVRVRTVSGDVSVTGPGEAGMPSPPEDPFGIQAAVMDAFGAGFPARPPTPPRPPRPPDPPEPPRPVTATLSVIPMPASATTSDPMTPDASARSTTASAQLAILRLVESGEIDVEEAARRLEALS